MRFFPRRQAIGAAVLFAGIALLRVAPSEAADLSDDVIAALVAQDAKNINDLLALDAATLKKRLPMIKSNAMMIAAYAQSKLGKDPANDGKYAALRKNALKVAEAVAAKKPKDSADAAKALNLTGSDPKADTKPLQLHTLHNFDINDLMAQYKKSAVGGLNIEEDIKAFAKKGGAKNDDAARIAARTLIISEFVDKMEPDGGFNPKKPKTEWDDTNKKMKVAAEELREVAKAAKADVKKLQAAFTKLDGACTACHNTFK